MKKMKKIFFLLIITLGLSTQIFAQKNAIAWKTVEEVEALQQKEPRKVLMDVYTTWCGPCKMMMKNTFTNANVIDYINANYYAIKFNAESGKEITFKGNVYSNPGFNPNARGRNSQHQFADALSISSYPTIIYLDEQLNVIAPIKGYKTPQQIELYLKLFAEDNYQEIGATKESFQNYYDSFKPTFHLAN